VLLKAAERAARTPVPYEERELPTDAQIEAVKTKTVTVEKAIRLVRAQGCLACNQKILAQEMEKQTSQLKAQRLRRSIRLIFS